MMAAAKVAALLRDAACWRDLFHVVSGDTAHTPGLIVIPLEAMIKSEWFQTTDHTADPLKAPTLSGATPYGESQADWHQLMSWRSP